MMDLDHMELGYLSIEQLSLGGVAHSFGWKEYFDTYKI